MKGVEKRRDFGWGNFLRGALTGACLAVAASSWLTKEDQAFWELAFSEVQATDHGLSERSAERINHAAEMFLEAFILVEQEHMEKELDEEVIDRMLDSALSELDPHSGFFDKKMALSMTSIGEGRDTPRLGIMIMDVGGHYTLEAIMPGSPAEKSGLMPGDRIVGVNGEDVRTLDPEAVNERIAAEIDRLGGGVMSLSVDRPSVDDVFEVSIDPEPLGAMGAYDLGREENVLHVHLERFYEGAAQDVARIIEKQLEIAPLEGVVLDLRDNGGGLTSEVKLLAERFLEKGTLLYEMSGRRIGVEAVRTEELPSFPELPLAVIMNGRSASASEIFAGAIQAKKRGKVFGWVSYGKGTVQRVYPVEAGAIKITVAEYRDGGLRAIDGIGVQPDVLADYPDPGHRPSRFAQDPIRDAARNSLGRTPYVASQ